MMSSSGMISMKMYASWEAEKSSSNAIPRLCSLSLVQIILDRPIEPECANTGFYVVVRMRDTARRVLRSPEITLICPRTSQSQNGLFNVHCNSLVSNPNEVNYNESSGQAGQISSNTTGSTPGSGGSVLIDFTCNIQYSHLLTRDSNTLQILLQRRKKYKSKAVNLGYKTLAYCNVNLAQVLQRRIENRFLDLYTDPKCSTHPVGRIEVLYLSSSPIEKDLLNGKRKVVDEDEDYPLPDVYSEQDDSDHGEETMSVGQKQIKQKLIGLLKKLKISDPNEVGLDVAATSKLWDEIDRMATASDMEEDSDAESINLISIQSTPRPTLRPFFATAGSSDDTLSADAGAKLLKRLQRELLAQSETDTSPDTVQLRSMLASVGKSVSLQKPFGKSSGKSDLLPLEQFTPPPTSSTVTFADTGPLQSTNSSRIHRSGGHSMSLAGGRFAKRFAHIRRRSNTNSSAKHIFGMPRSNKSNYIHESEPTIQETENIIESESSDDHSPTEGGLDSTFSQGQDSVFDPLGLPDSDLCRALPTSCSTPEANRRCTSRVVSNENPYVNAEEKKIHQNLSTDFISDHMNSENKYPETSLRCTDVDTLNWISMESEPSDLEKLANVTFIVSGFEKSGKFVFNLLSELNLRLISVNSFTELSTIFTRLANEAQSHTRRIFDGDFIKVCILGGNQLINLVLRAYVNQLSCRSTELATAFRFFIVPIDGLNKFIHNSSVHHSQINSGKSSKTMEVGVQLNLSSGPQQQQQHTNDSFNATVSRQPNSSDSNFTRASLSSIQISSYCNNLFAYHLCQIDPIYRNLFSEFCDESGSLDEDHAINVTNLSSKECILISRSELMKRIVKYVTTCRNVYTFPIGSCLLGSSKNTSTSVSKMQKSLTTDCTTSGNAASTNSNTANHLTQGATDQCCSHPDGVSGLTKGATVTGNPAHSEEMVIPFVLNVRLGNCLALAYPGLFTTLPTHPKFQQQQLLGKSFTGDTSFPSSVIATNTSAVDLDSKTPSDSEQSHTKRNISPESTACGTFTSPRIRRNFSLSFRSSKRIRKRKSSWSDGSNSTNLADVLHGSHSSTQRCSQSSVFGSDQRLWDIQIEYWSTPNLNVMSTPSIQSNQATTISTTANNNIAPCPTSPPSTTSDPLSPPRRSTLKTVSPGLVVTIDSSSTSACNTISPLRINDISSLAGEPNTSNAGNSPFRHVQFNLGHTHSQQLAIGLWSKEKKQKIMLIGRKGKGFSCRYELISGIQRLLCTGRGCNLHNTSSSITSGNTERSKDTESGHHHQSSTICSSLDSNALSTADCKPSNSISALGLALTGGGNSGFGVNTNHMMRVWIDGVEWTNLKFFQITPVWRTHVKFFLLFF
ncbi:unnamed protein product [Heterobilharzia americana]|nr:unnamed protein product [Heterobilharzia americana]